MILEFLAVEFYYAELSISSTVDINVAIEFLCIVGIIVFIFFVYDFHNKIKNISIVMLEWPHIVVQMEYGVDV